MRCEYVHKKYTERYSLRHLSIKSYNHSDKCVSSDHDIETIYIDNILKHADFSLGDLPEFLARLADISKNYGMDFVVSLSAEKEEMIGVDMNKYEILN